MELLGRPERQRCVGTERDAAEESAVGDDEEQAPVAFAGRSQQAQIGIELDAPFRVAWRAVEVRDPLVRRGERIDRELGHRRHPFVRPARAEWPAIGEGLHQRVAKSA